MAEQQKGTKRKLEEREDAAAGKTALYSYWRSSCSWRVRIALHVKGVEYEYRAVNLLKGDQLDASFERSPLRQLPLLQVDGVELHESMAIVNYLDETRPDPPLLPKDPKDRARVRAIVDTVACDTQPVQNLRVIKHVAALTGRPESRAEWGHHWITLAFEGLERQLAETAGRYAFGDEITMADVVIPPQVYNAGRFKVDMSRFPTIARVNANLAKLPEFARAAPDAQPDAQQPAA